MERERGFSQFYHLWRPRSCDRSHDHGRRASIVTKREKEKKDKTENKINKTVILYTIFIYISEPSCKIFYPSNSNFYPQLFPALTVESSNQPPKYSPAPTVELDNENTNSRKITPSEKPRAVDTILQTPDDKKQSKRLSNKILFSDIIVDFRQIQTAVHPDRYFEDDINILRGYLFISIGKNNNLFTIYRLVQLAIYI